MVAAKAKKRKRAAPKAAHEDDATQAPVARAERPPLEVRRVRVSDLHEDPANVRKHDPRNLDAIAGSLRTFGQVEPLVVQKGTGKVIGGNGRLAVLRKEGVEHVDVVELDLDDVQATSLAIALNRTAELASWDEPALARQLEALRAEDSGMLQASGFTVEELDDLLRDVKADPNFGRGDDTGVADPDTPEPPAEPTTRKGDLWILGSHRILCGRSESPEDLDRLLDGAKIHLVNTDPPYNVKVEPRTKNAIAAGSKGKGGITHHQKFDLARNPGLDKATGPMRARDRQLENDFLTDEAFQKILNAWFANFARVLIPGRAWYAWGGYSNHFNYPAAVIAADLFFSQCVIWVKQHAVLTRKDFMGDHEWCYYGWKKGAAHWFNPSINNATDVWTVKKVNPRNMVHLTEKPVELAARAMKYSSVEGENVLDLFGGSGSTMMAAEQLGRRAFSMETDPAYCDVEVQRWEEFTKKKAELVRVAR